MKPKLLYGTTNTSKIFEAGKYLGQFGITILSPSDVGLSLDIPEFGPTLEANAHAKIQAYINAGYTGLIITDDTGIEIDALNGEPGTNVSTWDHSGGRMTDQQIIDYCLTRMAGIPTKKRTAQFRAVIAVGSRRHPIETFSGTLRGTILEQPASLRINGFPFESLFFVPKWNMVLGNIHQLPPIKKRSFLSHHEQAIQQALPRIRELLAA